MTDYPEICGVNIKNCHKLAIFFSKHFPKKIPKNCQWQFFVKKNLEIFLKKLSSLWQFLIFTLQISGGSVMKVNNLKHFDK